MDMPGRRMLKRLIDVKKKMGYKGNDLSCRARREADRNGSVGERD